VPGTHVAQAARFAMYSHCVVVLVVPWKESKCTFALIPGGVLAFTPTPHTGVEARQAGSTCSIHIQADRHT
jgi:hypothetical protein